VDAVNKKKFIPYVMIDIPKPLPRDQDEHISESRSRDQDEQTAKSRINQDNRQQQREGALGKRLLDERLADLGELHERVLAVTGQSDDRVDHELVRGEGVDADGDGENEPASGASRLVQEDEDEGSPEAAEQGQESDDQAHHHTRWDDVAESLAREKAWESVALHGLEDVVSSLVEHIWVVAALRALNGVLDIIQETLRNDDLALRAGKKIGVEDLLCRSEQVLASREVVGSGRVLARRTRIMPG